MMNQLPPLKSAFGPSTTATLTKRPDSRRVSEIQGSIKNLFRELRAFSIEEVRTPEGDQKVRKLFNDFLSECHFHGAAADFKRLLKIKSGKDEKREDGTYSWQHELIPILYLLKMSTLPKSQGGFNLKDLDKYGGLEVFIRGHLHHDTVEDKGFLFRLKMNIFGQLERMMVDDTITYLRNKKLPFDIAFEQQQAQLAVQGVNLMTKKIFKIDADGQPVVREDGKFEKISRFKRTADYIYNMLVADTANPITYMLKLGDRSHNLIFFGSKKFTADKRKEYCNDCEDMYGGRDGFTDEAMAKWPEFGSAINSLDNVMGAMLYMNFNYLKYVDLAYPNKYQEGDNYLPSGFRRYLHDALRLDIPPAFSVIHINLHEMQKEAKRNPRAAAFLENTAYHALRGYEKYFPDILGNGHSHLPNSAAYAPNHM